MEATGSSRIVVSAMNTGKKLALHVSDDEEDEDEDENAGKNQKQKKPKR